MILHINDKTNSAKPLFYQSLVLLFLPCEKFGADDVDNELFVDAFCENEKYRVSIKLVVGDRCSECVAEENCDLSKHSQMKNLIGRTFLKAAYKIFGIAPPWGISTGVKPVKLARPYIEQFGADETVRILCEDYALFQSKAKMTVDACILEDSLMKKMGENPCSLYISIPFCPTKCNYCSFVSCTTPRLLSLIPSYVEKLKAELLTVSETIRQSGLNLKSIYVGGGTPAILDEIQIKDLLDCVYKHFDTDGCEITFEAGRPDCITGHKLEILNGYGISRISINTQTTNDEILRNIGRNHTFSDYQNSMELAKKIGFKCINTDLIAGLPGESVDSFCSSVETVESMCPENITVHAFTLKRSSNYRIDGEKSYCVSDADALKMTDFSSEFLSSKGYKPYYIYRQKNTTGNLENVGFSTTGNESIYNIVMMGEYHTVFGVGAGSVTKIVSRGADKVDRIFSPKYPYEFLDKTKYKGFDRDSVLKLLEER